MNVEATSMPHGSSYRAAQAHALVRFGQFLPGRWPAVVPSVLAKMP